MSDTRSAESASTAGPWYILNLLGFLLLVVGGWNLFNPLFPLQVGATEWEFGTASSFFDTVPLFGLGLGFLMASGLAGGKRIQVRTAAMVCILLALLLWLAAGLYATVVPQALNAAPSPLALTALKKAVSKAAVEILIYPVGFIWLGVWAWRRTLSRR